MKSTKTIKKLQQQKRAQNRRANFVLLPNEILLKLADARAVHSNICQKVKEWQLCVLPLIKYVAFAPGLNYFAQNCTEIEIASAKNGSISEYLRLCGTVGFLRDAEFAIGEALYKELFASVPICDFFDKLTINDCYETINGLMEVIKCVEATAK